MASRDDMPSRAASIAKSTIMIAFFLTIPISRITPISDFSNGQLANAGDTNFSISGKVGDTGSVTVTVAAAGKSATGSGRLTADAGGGHWTGGACSGSWTAERRGA